MKQRRIEFFLMVTALLIVNFFMLLWLQGRPFATVWANGLAAPAARPEAAVAIPTAFSYQGTLRLADGSLPTGSYNITLKLYSTVTGGTALHSEAFSNTVVRNGNFSVIVGDATPMAATLFDNTNLYIGVTVASDPEMLPRQRLLPVPWAMQAGTLALGAQGFGIVPIGAILPWHKSLSGTPALPVGWVECNGQTLNDPQSSLNGQVIPNLNGQALFIRGGATSGVFQDDQMQSHAHPDAGHTHPSHNTNFINTPANVDNNPGEYGLYLSSATGVGHADLGDPSETTAGAARHGSETRPVNMSMVWIMRVK